MQLKSHKLRSDLAPAISIPKSVIPEEYNIGFLKDEDTAIRESDVAAFKKAVEEE